MTDYDRDYYEQVQKDGCCVGFFLGAGLATAVCVLLYFCVR